MKLHFDIQHKIFHLHNKHVSYIMQILKNGHLGQLYFGKRVPAESDYSYLLEMLPRAMTSCVFPEDRLFSLEHLRQEYPVYGSTDYRQPALEVLHPDGSLITDLVYISHDVQEGKPPLAGLPATYVEREEEALTLTIHLKDEKAGLLVDLLYTLFEDGGILARSARIKNASKDVLHLKRAMSLSLDLPDHDYNWIQLSGAWARERHIKTRPLEQGIQSIGSMRGISSPNHNPFVVLARPDAGEHSGEVLGFSFIYSGNFLMQAEVDTHDTARMLVGIHPFQFDWALQPGECFTTPEAVVVYSDRGLGDMSRTFHRLFGRRLVKGYWRDRERPILNNNWEATYFDFTQDRLLSIAKKARECGIELFVLDDGWFGKRVNDNAGLGDWFPNKDRLPEGIAGLSRRVEEMGLLFGLWIEPEMVNRDSDLFRAHPDWILHVPGRRQSAGRSQYVLDYSRKEVVDTVYGMLEKVFSESRISYVKWDMNRSLTEVYSVALPPDRQGEVFHRYVLGVYDLYDRLTTRFPHILFESCSSGGGRFDPGILHYAPQGWASDNSDGIERLKIQYGTSLAYPISSIGSHVSAIPNHQVFRSTPLSTRANTAYFGAFGYELDLNSLSEEEIDEVKGQIAFMKKYRRLLQFGDFYRLLSPFEGNITAWAAVSSDKKTALIAWFRVLNTANKGFARLKLYGLLPEARYHISGRKGTYSGAELMNIGLITTDEASGEIAPHTAEAGDYASRIFVLQAE